MPDDQHSDPFEERFAAVLRDTGGAFDTDRGALAAGGQVRGRRIRLRRRAAVLGGAAGIALVGVGGTLLVPEGGGKASTATASTPTPTAPGAYTGQQLVSTLKALLPEGTFSGESGRGTGSGLPPSAHVVYDDGKGAAAISVGLNRVEPGSEAARGATRCPDKVLTAHDSCTTSTLPDGSRLMLLQGYEYPDRRKDTKWWSAELVTPQGQQVSVSEWNSAAEKDAPVSRPEPPLSVDELKKLATAPAWRRVAAALPEETRQPAPPEPGSTAIPVGDAVRTTLSSLLPKGVREVSGGGDGEYAYVVVDDGKGRSFVQINVQPDMSDVAGQLHGDVETLPDGTLVATRQGPGEKGGAGVVMWTVDTLRTDGMRVVISAFNAGSQREDATRDAPALTMKQLRAIALSPKWRKAL
ncbi:hypothetical protein [Streptomyces sp. TRM68367]|uniref:hypothetical protein n=1 Tax=Streptomyces sp. TRM68367 TaxID=2758415 RepID=UPI00165B8C3E|nr:hypothetical protein [Streptomyces sp. TRM68367]MBC9728366.1 hypothetical protein [Streptomyces sp. TRM68367]